MTAENEAKTETDSGTAIYIHVFLADCVSKDA